MNTVYCEEEHKKTVRKLGKPGGVIQKSDFLAWYVDWLFRGDESSDEEDEADRDKGVASGGGAESFSDVRLDSLFAVDKDSWKCDICSVRNDKDAKKCAACESPRPGFESAVATSRKGGDGSGSAIGSGGFSFGGGSGSGAIGSSGFTFGSAPTPVEEAKTGESKGGFTFGSTAAASPSPFSFGARRSDAAAASPSPFTFSSPAAPNKKQGSERREIPTVVHLETSYPPMSSHAPKPFGDTLASSYPPLSSKAPTLFGKPETKASGADGYPPMSSKAPKPFNTSSSSKSAAAMSSIGIEPSQSKTSTDGYPPMSSTAPTPFGASSVTKSHSTALSGRAPTPHGTTKTEVEGGGYPTMSSSAPKPFSSPSDPKPTDLSHPQMSTKVPSPFAPLSKTTVGGYPPMASTAPTPFGASSVAKPLSPSQPISVKPSKPSSTSASSVQSMVLGSESSRRFGKKPDPTRLSKVASKFLEISDQMEATLLRVAKFRKETERDEGGLEQNLLSLVDEVERVRTLLSSIGASLGKQRRASVAILSRKIDSERQAKEARHRTKMIKEKSATEGIAVETHPLDYESEKNRRKFASSAICVRGQMEMAKQQLAMFETAITSPDTGSILLARSVVDQYKRTIGLSGTIDRIESKVNAAKLSIPLQQSHINGTPTKGQTTYALTSGPYSSSKKQVMRPLPLAGALSPKQTQTRHSGTRGTSHQQWNDISLALHNLGSEHASTVKVGGALRPGSLLSSATDKAPRTEPRMARSLLLSPAERRSTPSKALVSSATTSTQKIAIVSPPSKTKARTGWDIGATFDLTKAKKMSFLPPNDLKESTLSDASRKTLASFGTTPEKVQESIDISKSQSTAARTSTRPQKNAAESLDGKISSPTRKVSTAAFPPMSTKAPKNPFSQKKETTRDEGSIKPKEASPYPPMSSVAPKPFGSRSSQSSGDASVETKAEASKAANTSAKPPEPASGFNNAKAKGLGDMQGLGSSLFSQGGNAPAPTDSAGVFGVVKSPSMKPSQDPVARDYKSILTNFYQKHNPAKISEVDKNLEKYKGREVEMFQKLASKYKVQSPLDGTQMKTTAQSTTLSGFENSSTSQSPFSASGGANAAATSASPFTSGSGATSTSSASPFTSGSAATPTSSASPFTSRSAATTRSASPFTSGSAATTTSSASPFSPGSSGAGTGVPSAFGKSTASPFGAPASAVGMASNSSFGNATSSNIGSMPLGSGSLASASPFGSSSGIAQSSPFGTAAAPAPSMQVAPTQNSLQGRSPREMLTQFYQQKNPSKLGEIDKVLAKYQGKEDQLFRNLAKKYQLDPSVFGLSSAPPAAGFGSTAPTPFGQTSSMGGGPSPFGQSGGFGQQPTVGFGASVGASSGHTFGSGIGSGQSASSFGSLAQSSSPSPFGTPASGGFGASAPAGGGFGSLAPASGFSSSAPASGGFGSPAPAFGATSSMGFGGNSPFGAPRR
eukprot:scaffold3875_cov123-Cylindrotheca_fusiformis.AAC.1